MRDMYIGSMTKSFKDSIKVLEADLQHANTLASDFSRDYDGACLQMRMSYAPAANLFLFLFQWTDCHLAGALGLLRILIYKVYVDGTTTMFTHERKASIKEFYAVIYPSLLQLQRGVTDTEDKKQKAVCVERYRRRDDEEHRQHTDIDIEREEECGICMEMNSKIVLPNCNHAMCLKCYREWYSLPPCLSLPLEVLELACCFLRLAKFLCQPHGEQGPRHAPSVVTVSRE
ncbi:E3 ubiquitin-protein ligase AIRP2 isoform X2 [Populus alba]|uniref:E3 ubiquitin-protein ligase AIRP2 isoform X2 n=1 Tax=Populus alba TaxID=43335 RepID=UPI001588C219|nr:E3 ubiquitin-protein ligase AIRP2-like isoform X2 [Populus alba]